jgi:hypothetical protein
MNRTQKSTLGELADIISNKEVFDSLTDDEAFLAMQRYNELRGNQVPTEYKLFEEWINVQELDGFRINELNNSKEIL